MVADSPDSDTQSPILSVRGLQVEFSIFEGKLRALESVDFTVAEGETLCVVGESGSGKSVTARSILNMVPPPGKITRGEILLRRETGETVDILAQKPRGKAMRGIRGNDIGMVFQEPMASLSPVHTIGSIFIEAVQAHRKVGRAEAREMAIAAMADMGIPKPAQRIDYYPFQLSGGMRQRAMIAIALANRPRLLIADEPTTALDVTTQANVLDLMIDIQDSTKMALLFITHDLGVVAEIAHNVVVMYLGRIVESGTVHEIFEDARHPYTQALLRSIPGTPLSESGGLYTIKGSIPSRGRRPQGCPFHPRCDQAVAGVCDVEAPPLRRLRGNRTYVCHLPLELKG
ncbi:ABC transporter ATP-binding protein [Oceaniglobus trochenteri]|uniref:ABC transporter ATP-binding protein n=1 Tax=Oceaniglobus trochenteri TaxID=2763260 RepID=UPI001CFF9E44|nr:ABC transporter ATP-binding protein [Oceaniglobus trochenteri]